MTGSMRRHKNGEVGRICQRLAEQQVRYIIPARLWEPPTGVADEQELAERIRDEDQ